MFADGLESIGLSIKQRQAIELMVAGRTDAEIAQEIGSARSTINRWRNQDPNFRESLEVRLRPLFLKKSKKCEKRTEEAKIVSEVLRKRLPKKTYYFVVNWFQDELAAAREETTEAVQKEFAATVVTSLNSAVFSLM